jgi:hypothetical protein
MNIYRFSTIAGLIILAIITRFLPHPMNFTPIAAIALFGGAYFSNRWLAFVAPLAIMFLSDLLLQIFTGNGFHSGMYLVYGSFALVTLLGIMMQNKISPLRVLTSSIGGTLLFYFITNFAFFYPESAIAQPELGNYPHNLTGIMASYAAGLPFLKNALVGDIFYSSLLFGGFYWLENKFSVLKIA